MFDSDTFMSKPFAIVELYRGLNRSFLCDFLLIAHSLTFGTRHLQYMYRTLVRMMHFSWNRRSYRVMSKSFSYHNIICDQQFCLRSSWAVWSCEINKKKEFWSRLTEDANMMLLSNIQFSSYASVCHQSSKCYCWWWI